MLQGRPKKYHTWRWSYTMLREERNFLKEVLR